MVFKHCVRSGALLAIFAALTPGLLADNNSPVTLDNSEILFSVLSAINHCGYDEELKSSDPLRFAVRNEVGRAVEASEQAKDTANSICSFYRDHQQADPVRTLSQYISLALYLTEPPAFAPKVKDSELPPDASGLLGMVPLLGKFYAAAGLHQIWERHADAYRELAGRYRDSFQTMTFNTELYLRLPSGSYLGRNFSILVEPLGAPSLVNARNYGQDYYIVITPGSSAALKMDQIRHTYLHYLLDPTVGKYAVNLSRLEPLLDTLKLAPMDESFKVDPALLVAECVIRSIEARTLGGGKTPPGEQERAVQDSMSQGFVLTQYFYERLPDFEKDTVGFKNWLPAILAQIDLRKEERRAGQVQFASSSEPELLHLSRPKEGKLLQTAEERLSAGDAETAEKLAKQALAEKTEDPGRALFILAQISLNKNMNGARDYFEQALKSTSEPKVIAWSHIYIGRILDLQDDAEGGPLRTEAVSHYRAAVGASDTLPEARAAAEQGLRKPYEPPHQPGNEAPKSDDEKQ